MRLNIIIGLLVLIGIIILCKPRQFDKFEPLFKDDHPSGICGRHTLLEHPRFTHPCCVSNGIKMLKDVSSTFDKYNVPIWLTYGTLLGYLRHGGFIPWDDDIDMMSLEKFSNTISEKIAPELKKLGYNVKRIKRATNYSDAPDCDYFSVDFSETNKLHIDIGLCTGPIKVNTKGSENHMIDGPENSIKTIVSDPIKYKQWIHPAKELFPLRTVKMYGVKLLIPRNSKKLIKDIYDETCLVKAKIKNGNVSGLNSLLKDIEITDFSPAAPLYGFQSC